MSHHVPQKYAFVDKKKITCTLALLGGGVLDVGPNFCHLCTKWLLAEPWKYALSVCYGWSASKLFFYDDLLPGPSNLH